MRKIRKAKFLIKAAIVTVIALALIMPSAITDTNNLKNNETFKLPENVMRKPLSLSLGDDVLVSPFVGDDYMPSITEDMDGNAVVSWTNEQSFSESYFGISYSDDPLDASTWSDNALTLEITGNDFSFDTALVIGPEPDDYKGLVGVFYSLVDDLAGYYEIPDVTDDFANWAIYTWSSFGTESEYATIADQGFVQGGYYPDMFGPMALHICLNDLCGDVPECPVFIHIDIRNDGGGVMFYDCQEDEQTAPAADPDFVWVDEIYHTVVYNKDTESVIWKKVDATIEHDYEYTPFQETVGSGTNPAIAAIDTNVAILYVSGGTVKCAYSADDGESWNTVDVASGEFPDICAVGNQLFATYIVDGNLFKIISDDYGITWSDPEQVNDVDGTVAEIENAVDIHEAGIVWVDERGSDYDVYYDALVTIPKPKLDISDIAGGIGVSAVITNTGDAGATNVNWEIVLDGTVFLGGSTTGTEASLGVGDSVPIKSGFPLGFGDIDISITASCDEGATASESAAAKLLLFFITGL
jgi:hypothetical protein